jgi:hypothetical protein
LVIFCIFAATVNFSASFSPTFDCQVLWADWSWKRSIKMFSFQEEQQTTYQT